MKTCNKCATEKPTTEFGFKDVAAGKLNAWCKECNREYQREHYKTNKIVYAKKAREWENANGGLVGKRLRGYNLTLDEYTMLMSKHDGLCWICVRRKATVIDHDHDCCPGATSCGLCVRGVLCRQCNTGIGLLGDSVDSLKSAVDYLES